MPTIIGIDPGVATTGWGVIKQTTSSITAVAYGVISTPAKQPLAQRLMTIADDFEKLIKKYQPDKLAIEELFFAKNVTTALAVGQARGVILLLGQRHKLPISEYTPLQVKQAITSFGQADKKQVQKMVAALLRLQTIPQPDDAADALAIAITCAHSPALIPHK